MFGFRMDWTILQPETPFLDSDPSLHGSSGEGGEHSVRKRRQGKVAINVRKGMVKYIEESIKPGVA